MLDLCGGEASEIVTAGSMPDWRRRYVLRAERPRNPRRASTCRPEESAAILTALGFAVERLAGGDLAVEPPSWRGDVEGEADLVEEVLRVKGYDLIPPVPLDRDDGSVAPVPDAEAAAGGARPSHARLTRADRGGDVFVHLRARGRAVRRRQAGTASRQPDQRRSRRDAALAAARASSSAARRNADRGLSRHGSVRAGSALSRRYAGGAGAGRGRTAGRAERPQALARNGARGRSL